MGRDYLAWRSEVDAHKNATGNVHGMKPSDIGLGNVDNTSDANKPVSTAQAAAIADAKKAGTDAQANLTAHNTNTSAHNDIRVLLAEMSARLNAALDSDDTTLDQMSEIVAYIKSNKALIDSITTSKVNVGDIINNLTTNVSNKPLSAAQGVVLKALIDALQTEVNGKSEDGHKHAASDITSGTFGVARGGTGKASWEANRLMYPSAAEVLAQMAFPTTAGSFLRQDKSGAPYWSTPAQVLAAIGGAAANHTHDAAEVGALPDGTVPITKGGTGATDAATACNNLGAMRNLASRLAGIGFDSTNELYITIDGTNYSIPFGYTRGSLVKADGSVPILNALFVESDGQSHTSLQNYQGVTYVRNQIDSPYSYRGLKLVADNNIGYLEYGTEDAYHTYPIYSTANVPEGYYTGNGSATQRSIEIPNALRGKALLIFSDGYTDGVPDTVALIAPLGGFSRNNSNVLAGVGKDEARYSLDDDTNTAYLVISSTSECLNKNGVKYYYKGL